MIAEQPCRAATASSSGPDSHRPTAAPIVALVGVGGQVEQRRQPFGERREAAVQMDPPSVCAPVPTDPRILGVGARHRLTVDPHDGEADRRRRSVGDVDADRARARTGPPGSRAAATPACASATAATSPTGHGVASTGSAPTTSTAPSSRSPPSSATCATRVESIGPSLPRPRRRAGSARRSASAGERREQRSGDVGGALLVREQTGALDDLDPGVGELGDHRLRPRDREERVLVAPHQLHRHVETAMDARRDR